MPEYAQKLGINEMVTTNDGIYITTYAGHEDNDDSVLIRIDLPQLAEPVVLTKYNLGATVLSNGTVVYSIGKRDKKYKCWKIIYTIEGSKQSRIAKYRIGNRINGSVATHCDGNSVLLQTGWRRDKDSTFYILSK